MKSVLISIQPKWVEKICRKEKTVEVRKTKPKLDTPFKVYIYETQGRTETPFVDEEGHYSFKGRGQVIGEFVCDKIDKIFQCNSGWVKEHACLSREEFFAYLGLPYNSHFDNKGAYAWHITDLVVYDEPRELSEFYKLCDGYCFDSAKKHKCASFNPDNRYSCNNMKPLKRPPQSWCYVESEDTE